MARMKQIQTAHSRLAHVFGVLVLAAAVECADPGLDVVQIRRQLRNGLPSFMIPERMRILASLPLNGNGKVDRLAVTQRLSRTD